MGVDTTIKVRFLNKENEKQLEVYVSDQDNSLDSLLQSNGDKIKYTNIVNDKTKALTEDECKLFTFQEVSEMEMETEIVEAKRAFKMFKKLYWHIEYIGREIALQDFNKHKNMEASEDEILKQQISDYRNYFYFNNSFSTFLGIIKTAAEMDANIQIIAEYY
jgi:hypothetical protein